MPAAGAPTAVAKLLQIEHGIDERGLPRLAHWLYAIETKDVNLEEIRDTEAARRG